MTAEPEYQTPEEERETALDQLKEELEQKDKDELGAFLVDRLWVVGEIAKDIIDDFAPEDLTGRLLPYIQAFVGPLLAIEAAAGIVEARDKIIVPGEEPNVTT